MEIFKELAIDKHEQVVFCSDRVSGLRSIIVIHDTTLEAANRLAKERLSQVKRLKQGHA